MTLKGLQTNRQNSTESDSRATSLQTNSNILSVREHLQTIYRDIELGGSDPLGDLAHSVIQLCEAHLAQCPTEPQSSRWDQSDVALICYGDNVNNDSAPTLKVLKQFLLQHGIDDVLNTVHLLPINPYTSDDGFSVVDYRKIHSDLGDWEDVNSLGQDFDLMFDLVLNHCSQESDYFKKFLEGDEHHRNFFIAADPELDYSKVMRPRSLPLLSPKESADGTVHIWTTFSDDQVDLNYADPAVLLEMLGILLFYARNGGRIVRLDAIAYLWKELGTNCIHLPQTHEFVKLMRTCLNMVQSRTLLLTETNVPHRENISYFGDGDEAHLVYQFSLPPLLLDAFFNEDASVISPWLETVCDTLPGATNYFNFTASHDGIGVRPLEGIVSPERVEKLADVARSIGGKVGMKANSDGSESPYELNVTYVDMLLTELESDAPGIERFMTSQAVMLAMKGIPGIYFHSLFGTQNDIEAVEKTDIPRRINRRKFSLNEINDRLSVEDSLQARILARYKQLLVIRRSQPAFHPDAKQSVRSISNQSVLAFQRQCPQTGQDLTVLANFSAQPRTVLATELDQTCGFKDLITEKEFCDETVKVEAHGILWLNHKKATAT
jgi:sucrose phosphorylase